MWYKCQYKPFLWLVFVCANSKGLAGSNNGFRGGSKSYAIKVEANSVGTNLQYELPEAKVKAAPPNDWFVDNDNAEMTLAMNSPILATLQVKHPKFSMKGQWPGYKFSFKPPDEVTSTKKHDFGRPADTKAKIAIPETGHLENKDLTPHNKTENTLSYRKVSNKDINFRNSTRNASKQLKNLKSATRKDWVSSSHEGDLEENKYDGTKRKSFKADPGKEKNMNGRNRALLQKEKKSVNSMNNFDKIATAGKKRLGNDELMGTFRIAGIKLPRSELKSVNFDNPAVKQKMARIVKDAKAVVNEAKIVLKDASRVVGSVKNLVHGDNSQQLDSTRLHKVTELSVDFAAEQAAKAAFDAHVAAQNAELAAADSQYILTKIKRTLANNTFNNHTEKILETLQSEAEQAAFEAGKAREEATKAKNQENLVHTIKSATRAKQFARDTLKQANISAPSDLVRPVGTKSNGTYQFRYHPKLRADGGQNNSMVRKPADKKAMNSTTKVGQEQELDKNSSVSTSREVRVSREAEQYSRGIPLALRDILSAITRKWSGKKK